MSKQLLVIEDEETMCDLIEAVAKDCGYQVTATQTPSEFTDKFMKQAYDLILLDLQLSDSTDGIQLLRFLANKNCHTPIIVMSAFAEKILSTAVRLGKSHGLNMFSTLQKPFDINDLIKTLSTIQLPPEPVTAESLVKALKEDNYVLHYQPKISFQTKKLIGVEVLLRCQPPNQELIYPDKFIKISEDCNIIKPITTYLVKKSFEQLSNWQKMGYDFGIAINLSALVLDDLSLPDQISDLAIQFGINNQKVCFEITESVLMNKLKIVMDILVRLRLKGFNLSIDDFGTGYSSLVELYHMPFNEIKIDKSFISNLEHDNEAQIITRAIIDLGHNLGLSTVAEGVETLPAWELLNKYGCDIAQGYYINPPGTAKQLEEWIAAR